MEILEQEIAKIEASIDEYDEADTLRTCIHKEKRTW